MMAQPLLHTIYKDMLDERAQMVYYLMQGVKNVKGTERVQIIRGNGIEAAFGDDKTLKAVEDEYGELNPEWIIPRLLAIGGKNVAKGVEYPKFKEAFKQLKEMKGGGASHYIEESDGKRLFTYLVQIEERQSIKKLQ